MPSRTLKPAKSSISSSSRSISDSLASLSLAPGQPAASGRKSTKDRAHHQPKRVSPVPSSSSFSSSSADSSDSERASHSTSAKNHHRPARDAGCCSSATAPKAAISRPSGPRPALKGYPADFSSHIPGYCAHRFEVVKSETTARLWTCESCSSTPHWFIFECRNCSMKTCRPCTYHE